MRAGRFLVAGVLILPITAMASPATETHSFAIVRNGERIGTNTICLHHDGPDTLVEISTSIAVKIAFLTLYRFEQTEIGADLIVMATHGRKGLSHFILGSVAERVMREADCPVLTMRTKVTSA